MLGLDIGTTSTIGILCDLDTGYVWIASRPVDLVSPQAGWAEEDPNQWWHNVCSLCNELLGKVPNVRRSIAGIGVTGMVPAVVLLDAKGYLLRPSIQQSDSRCAREVEELCQEMKPAEFISLNGNGINQQLVTAKLRWIERHEPEVFSHIATVFGSYDYINWLLTGSRRVERNWALEGGFIELESGLISRSLTDLTHLPPEAFPPLSRCDEVIGIVSVEAAEATSLPADLPVCGGAADHIASAYAAGVLAEGDALLKFGGSGDVLMATMTPAPDVRMYLDYHLIPGLYMPNGCMATSGSLLNWATHTIMAGEAKHAREAGLGIHAHLDRLAEDIPPGSEGVTTLPYFLGEKTPIHDPYATGTVVGLGLHHGVGHIWRSLLEGIAFGFRHHLEVLAEMGHPVQRLLASDGGAASQTWMQIIADVLQRPVGLLEGHPGSCLGAAWCAAIATGAVTNWEGVTRFVTYGRRVEPDSAQARVYGRGYERYRTLYETLRPWYRYGYEP